MLALYEKIDCEVSKLCTNIKLMLSFWTDTIQYLPHTKVMQVHIGIEKKGNLRHEISRIEAEPPKRTAYTKLGSA